MIQFPNPLRERWDARKKLEGGDRPLPLKERLGRGMGQPDSKLVRKQFSGLLFMGLLVILSAVGLLVVKMNESRSAAPVDTRERLANLPKMDPHPDDARRWDGSHLAFKDGPGLLQTESQDFRYFIDRLNRVYSREKIAEMVLADREQMLNRWEGAYGQPSKFPDATARRVMWDYPEISRGKFFKVSGPLLEFHPEKDSLWRGVMRDSQTGGTVHFYTPGMPRASDGRPLPEKDPKEGSPGSKIMDNVWCELQGVLLKVQTIEGPPTAANRRHVPREAAVLVIGTFRDLPSPVRHDLGRHVIMGVLFMAGLIGAVLTIGFLLTRKYNRSLDMRIKLGLARMKRAKSGDLDWKSITE